MSQPREINPEALLAEVRQKLEDIRAADTPENEVRLIGLLESKGAVVKRGRQKSPARYTLRMANGTTSPLTLLDLEGIWRKVSGEGP